MALVFHWDDMGWSFLPAEIQSHWPRSWGIPILSELSSVIGIWLKP